MEFIFIGIIGFISMLLFDIFSMIGKNALKYLFGIIGVAVIIISTGFILYEDIQIKFSGGVIISNFLFLIIFGCLLFYSLFFEVGVMSTYGKNNKPSLVTKGTYGLVRHPGVIWLLIVFINLYFIFGNELIIYTGITWTLVNVVYVYIQEKFIFEKIFIEYKEYKKVTPMIIPTFNSIKTTFKYDNWRKQWRN